jgi:hypothetical protein
VSCLAISDILASKPQNSSCKRITEAFPDCVCERISICPLDSPGVVESTENVARFARRGSRGYDEETGEVLRSLFEHAERNGMSVTRVEKAGKEALIRQQNAGGYCGYVKAKVGDLRKILANGKRGFAIYDTALPGNPNHADVCANILPMGSHGIALRNALFEAFTQASKRPIDGTAES